MARLPGTRTFYKYPVGDLNFPTDAFLPQQQQSLEYI